MRRGGERTQGSDLMLCQRAEEKSWRGETLRDEGRKRRGEGVHRPKIERQQERRREERGLEQGKGEAIKTRS